MSIQLSKTLWAGALLGAVLVMSHLSKGEAQDQQQWLTAYCTEAAVWAAEEARGVPLNQRTGQPDYRGIAAEQCPGMRPAGPAIDDDYRAPARLAIPDAAPIQQLVQF
ncbi:hypothetical protein [Vreelandella nanhaiensis]|uniref:Uncharacterized protein n=1 Tax=Vreelandella nanhaiensis TaxID=1258546 RepID=A0A3S1DUL2_9GAMM|nr:hypothetical protein [Halomonas nanhaiensis]RUR34504.1 hypothetical protein ELY38_02625 [Halomonas nanhaiensis]